MYRVVKGKVPCTVWSKFLHRVIKYTPTILSTTVERAPKRVLGWMRSPRLRPWPCPQQNSGQLFGIGCSSRIPSCWPMPPVLVVRTWTSLGSIPKNADSMATLLTAPTTGWLRAWLKWSAAVGSQSGWKLPESSTTTLNQQPEDGSSCLRFWASY